MKAARTTLANYYLYLQQILPPLFLGITLYNVKAEEKDCSRELPVLVFLIVGSKRLSTAAYRNPSLWAMGVCRCVYV